MEIGAMIASGVGIAAAAGVGVSMLRAATTYKAKPTKDADGYPQENADVERFEASESQEEPIMMEHPTMEVPEGFTLYDETDQEV
jgi:hypothetical protein